jgi:alpha-glucosidase
MRQADIECRMHGWASMHLSRPCTTRYRCLPTGVTGSRSRPTPPGFGQIVGVTPSAGAICFAWGPECVQDVFEQRVPGYGLNRDPERSPMRWDDSANGGFTSGRPWLPMGHDIGERNVARLQQDPCSLLWLYCSLIRLRKQEKALTAGSYVPMRSRDDMLMFKRSYAGAEFLIALNFSHDPRKLPFDATAALLISTHLDRDLGAVQSSLILRGDEGMILRLSSPQLNS